MCNIWLLEKKLEIEKDIIETIDQNYKYLDTTISGRCHGRYSSPPGYKQLDTNAIKSLNSVIWMIQNE